MSTPEVHAWHCIPDQLPWLCGHPLARQVLCHWAISLALCHMYFCLFVCDRVSLRSSSLPCIHYVAQAEPKLMATLLPQPPKGWGHRCALPHLACLLSKGPLCPRQPVAVGATRGSRPRLWVAIRGSSQEHSLPAGSLPRAGQSTLAFGPLPDPQGAWQTLAGSPCSWAVEFFHTLFPVSRPQFFLL